MIAFFPWSPFTKAGGYYSVLFRLITLTRATIPSLGIKRGVIKIKIFFSSALPGPWLKLFLCLFPVSSCWYRWLCLKHSWYSRVLDSLLICLVCHYAMYVLWPPVTWHVVCDYSSNSHSPSPPSSSNAFSLVSSEQDNPSTSGCR